MKYWKVLWTRAILKAEEYFAEVRAGKIKTDFLSVGDKRKMPLKKGDEGVIVVKEGDGKKRAVYATFLVTGEAKRMRDPNARFLVDPKSDKEQWRVPICYGSAFQPVTNKAIAHLLKMPSRTGTSKISRSDFRLLAKVCKLAEAQIGRRGELLVQSRLLGFGIESAPMTTDSGIDLIALRSVRKGKATPVSIQVKTTARIWEEKDGKRKCYSWPFPKESPADLIAFVAVDEIPERIWLFEYANERKKSKGGSFDMYIGGAGQALRTVKKSKPHLLENIVAKPKFFPPKTG